jgi:hypothetical protein
MSHASSNSVGVPSPNSQLPCHCTYSKHTDTHACMVWGIAGWWASCGCRAGIVRRRRCLLVSMQRASARGDTAALDSPGLYQSRAIGARRRCVLEAIMSAVTSKPHAPAAVVGQLWADHELVLFPCHDVGEALLPVYGSANLVRSMETVHGRVVSPPFSRVSLCFSSSKDTGAVSRALCFYQRLTRNCSTGAPQIFRSRRKTPRPGKRMPVGTCGWILLNPKAARLN